MTNSKPDLGGDPPTGLREEGPSTAHATLESNGSGGWVSDNGGQVSDWGVVGKPWPWVAQFAVVLGALGLAFVLVLLPMLIGMEFSGRYELTSGMDIWGPMVSTLLGLTTMTVAGIFVFMTFRIDRGVRHEVREAVREYIGGAMKRAIAIEMSATRDRVKAEIEKAEEEFKKKTSELRTEVKNEAGKVSGAIADFAVRTSRGFSGLEASLNKRLSQIENNVGRSIDEMEGRLRTQVLEANLNEAIEEESERSRSKGGEADDDSETKR